MEYYAFEVNSYVCLFHYFFIVIRWVIGLGKAR